MMVSGRMASETLHGLASILHHSYTKDRYLAILRLYVDDSGSQDMGSTTAFVMAGYVASEEQWGHFESEWSVALRDAGAARFRSADFFPRVRAFSGPAWKDNTRHRQFSRRFTGIAERNVAAGVGRGIEVAAYRDIVFPDPLLAPGTPNQRFTPIMACARMCLEWIACDWPDRPQGEEISVIFEEGTAGLGALIEYCLWLKKTQAWGSIYCSFAPGPKSFLPLQAADLIAYETYRHVTEELKPTGRPRRKSFVKLLRSDRVSIRIGNRETFLSGMDDIRKFLASQ